MRMRKKKNGRIKSQDGRFLTKQYFLNKNSIVGKFIKEKIRSGTKMYLKKISVVKIESIKKK